jgi:DNA polymerase III subunit delta'
MPFSDFLGHPRIVTTLRGMLASGHVPHAMLFGGPRGVGKFTLARMFAQAANCERLRDDFCGECDNCRRIGRLADLPRLVEQGLVERGESADAATVERVPLLIETHPDVWAVVPDPVRLKSPVVRPVLHVGQLRAVQRAAYFKPVARRRVFILDDAETMRSDHANIFLKILEEPPESATLILLATRPYVLLPTIRSRCLQFFFAPLGIELVEQILITHAGSPSGSRSATWPALSADDRRLAAQLAEGSPGAALALDLKEAVELRRTVLGVLAAAAEARSSATLFAQTTLLTKGQRVPFETVLEVFYSLLTDLLELSAGCAGTVLRNPPLEKELIGLSHRVDPLWVSRAVQDLDELASRLRRNINRQLSLDAVAMSLSGNK